MVCINFDTTNVNKNNLVICDIADRDTSATVCDSLVEEALTSVNYDLVAYHMVL